LKPGFHSHWYLSVTRADGAGKPQALSQSKNPQYPWSFTGDGKRLAYNEGNAGTGYDLWTMPLENNGKGLRAGKPEIFLQTPFEERYAYFSPDGQWIAYTSNESGTFQVYVRPFPGAPGGRGGRWPISNNGGVYPVFSHDGHSLFFLAGDNRIMVATYTVKGDSFVAEKPRVWSEKRPWNIDLTPNFDVMPDGKRMAVLTPVQAQDDQNTQNHVIFLENFLRRAAAESADGQVTTLAFADFPVKPVLEWVDGIVDIWSATLPLLRNWFW
jgi:Tol biopolymer transport system component